MRVGEWFGERVVMRGSVLAEGLCLGSLAEGLCLGSLAAERVRSMFLGDFLVFLKAGWLLSFWAMKFSFCVSCLSWSSSFLSLKISFW